MTAIPSLSVLECVFNKARSMLLLVRPQITWEIPVCDHCIFPPRALAAITSHISNANQTKEWNPQLATGFPKIKNKCRLIKYPQAITTPSSSAHTKAERVDDIPLQKLSPDDDRRHLMIWCSSKFELNLRSFERSSPNYQWCHRLLKTIANTHHPPS